MKKLILLTILSLPLAAQANPSDVPAQWPRAVDARLTPQYRTCMGSGAAAQGQTLAMKRCQVAEIERQDGRLNQAYMMVMKRLSPKRKAALRQSERAWIGKRDRICQAAAARYRGGSAAGIEAQACYLRETIARTLWLERYR